MINHEFWGTAKITMGYYPLKSRHHYKSKERYTAKVNPFFYDKEGQVDLICPEYIHDHLHRVEFEQDVGKKEEGINDVIDSYLEEKNTSINVIFDCTKIYPEFYEILFLTKYDKQGTVIDEGIVFMEQVPSVPGGIMGGSDLPLNVANRYRIYQHSKYKSKGLGDWRIPKIIYPFCEDSYYLGYNDELIASSHSIIEMDNAIKVRKESYVIQPKIGINDKVTMDLSVFVIKKIFVTLKVCKGKKGEFWRLNKIERNEISQQIEILELDEYGIEDRLKKYCKIVCYIR